MHEDEAFDIGNSDIEPCIDISLRWKFTGVWHAFWNAI